MALELGPFSLDRVVCAVEKVRDRLLRSTVALERAGIPYAVVGGHAVAAWVARVDESAVRNTRGVDILIRRDDLPSVRSALEPAGFVYRHSARMDLSLDGPDGKARDAVHIVFAKEKVREEEPVANPDVTDSEQADAYRIIALPSLVQIKLTAFRDKDRTHLRDMIELGMVDATWPGRFLPELGARLQMLLDTPGG